MKANIYRNILVCHVFFKYRFGSKKKYVFIWLLDSMCHKLSSDHILL